MGDDPRFSHIKTDPKFRRLPRKRPKTQIDKRFKSMFKDQRFQTNYKTDKRGKPISQSSGENLKQYYGLSGSDQDSDKDDNVDDEKNSTVVKGKWSFAPDRMDYARGDGLLSSSSSDSDSEEDNSSSNEDPSNISHNWGELDCDAERTNCETNRLAACNMNWDRIRAIDLMVLFNSFLPTNGGRIKSVLIYPSEFGKKRMQDEETLGPLELVEKPQEDEEEKEEEEENEEGTKYHMEKLRQYQLNRLRYYYAVINFDTVEAASRIYSECDGMEYESSATRIDLRFIPDSVDFDGDGPPHDQCEFVPDRYEPRFFATSALQQAKVNLTWDETAPERLEFTQKVNSGKLDGFSRDDLKNYLASSSSEENSVKSDEEIEQSNENQDALTKYKSLLNEIETKEREKQQEKIEMEVTWCGLDLKEKTEQLVEKKIQDSEEKTPFQKYLDRKKEKRKQKKQKSKDSDSVPSDVDLDDPYFAEEFQNGEFKSSKVKDKNRKLSTKGNEPEENKELELLMLEDNVEKRHFSLKKIQAAEDEKTKKKKRRKQNEEASKDPIQDNFEINVDDERFSAIYNSHHFNIDRTDPHYKKTKGMESLIDEKLKRRTNEEQIENSTIENQDGKSSKLSVLIKSVKRKTEALNQKKLLVKKKKTFNVESSQIEMSS